MADTPKDRNSMSRARRSGGRARRMGIALSLSLLAIVLLDRALLYTALSDGVLLGTYVAPFSPPLFDPKQFELLERLEDQLANERATFDKNTLFDADLGWCPRPGQKRGHQDFDWAGARIGLAALPENVDERGSWLALLGCSFTMGTEVAGDESWAAELERREPGRHVGNFGVAGYGVDQALLRYRRDVAHLQPNEVWLGFYPNAALRATSHYPPLYHRWRARTLNFKPRFTLAANGGVPVLEFHASPTAHPEDIPRLLRDPAAFLAALDSTDAWIARARAAYVPAGEHWSHDSGIARILLTIHERGGRDIAPMLRDATSEAYRLNHALIVALAREVEAAGASFRLIVLPGSQEIAELAETGSGYWQEICDSLEREGVAVTDLTPQLIQHGVDQDARHWAPNRHYSPGTHKLVAELLDGGS